jgi:hypothetical protein
MIPLYEVDGREVYMIEEFPLGEIMVFPIHNKHPAKETCATLLPHARDEGPWPPS